MGSNDSSQTDSAPWSSQVPYLEEMFKRAQGLADYEPSYYDGPYQGPRSAMHLEGEQAGLDLIRGGQGSGGAASDYLNDTLSGQYLSRDSNPYLQERFDRGASDITRHYQRAVSPGLSMEAMGRGGSGREANLTTRAQENLGDRLGKWEADMFGSHYDAERGRMGQAAGLAPGVDASRRSDIMAGYGTGDRASAYAQVPYSQAMQQHNFEQNIPYKQLQAMSAGLGAPIQGSQSTTTSTGFGAGEGVGMGISLLGMLLCSREWKNPISPADAESVLIQLLQMPIDIWQYKDEFAAEHPEVDSDPHIGPYAEDMNELFAIGDGKRINVYDLTGIALSAVQAVALRAATQNETIERLEKRIEAIEMGTT